LSKKNTGLLDDESVQVLHEIIDTVDGLIKDPAEVMQRVESVARYHFMQRKMDEFGVGWDSKKLCQFDYYWDKIGGGVAERLREIKGWGWHGFSDRKTKFRSHKEIITPPKDTRAHVRGKLIKDSDGHNDSSWYYFDLIELGGGRMDLHPLTTEIPRNQNQQ
jgi:hypothetical protein